MRISVIVPAYNAAPTMARALDAVLTQLSDGDELIVVDDGSTDGTADAARREGVQLLVLPSNAGVGHARNRGAAMATGEVLLFTDADAELRPDVVDGIRDRFTGQPEISAWVGLYAASCLDEGLVSRFKNLWIRHSYLAAAPDVDFLFGCLCALRRDLFHELGGFDTVFHRNTGGVDIELGFRMHGAGHAIRLDPALQVEHWRSFSLGGLMLNDFRRASGYARLGLANDGASGLASKPSIANISRSYVIGTALVGLTLGSIALAPLLPPLGVIAGLAAVGHGLLNLPLYAYFWGEDRAVGLASPVLLVASQLAAGFGVLWGVATYLRRGPP